MINIRSTLVTAAVALSASTFTATDASAQLFSLFSTQETETVIDRQMPAARGEAVDQQDARGTDLPAHLRRQIVSYTSSEAPGTIIVDTPNTYLYYVLGGGRAVRYGIGVGREGFTWAGTKTVERKAEWPDWHPPAEMIARQPYLPRFMAGGPGNPMGARAMYLSGSVYRIHGTNAPKSIGTRVSSGCIRMLNEDVQDLYSRVNVGTKVVVLPAAGRRPAEAQTVRAPAPARTAALRSVDTARLDASRSRLDAF